MVKNAETGTEMGTGMARTARYSTFKHSSFFNEGLTGTGTWLTYRGTPILHVLLLLLSYTT